MNDRLLEIITKYATPIIVGVGAAGITTIAASYAYMCKRVADNDERRVKALEELNTLGRMVYGDGPPKTDEITE